MGWMEEAVKDETGRMMEVRPWEAGATVGGGGASEGVWQAAQSYRSGWQEPGHNRASLPSEEFVLHPLEVHGEPGRENDD